MTVQVTPECKLFNCDKKHGNYCCYYCDQQCENRCLNDPSACDNYLVHKNYYSYLTENLPQGKIEVTGTQKECLRKLSDYEATKLQPQQIVQLVKDYRWMKAELERIKGGGQQ